MGTQHRRQSVTFTDIAKNVVLLVGHYVDGKIEPIDAPFIIRDDCSVQPLAGHAGRHNQIGVDVDNCASAGSVDGRHFRKAPTPGTEYELFYWQDGWQSLGKAIAGKDPLVFDKAPTGCLYWLVATGSDKDERIFTIEDGKQVWW